MRRSAGFIANNSRPTCPHPAPWSQHVRNMPTSNRKSPRRISTQRPRGIRQADSLFTSSSIANCISNGVPVGYCAISCPLRGEKQKLRTKRIEKQQELAQGHAEMCTVFSPSRRVARGVREDHTHCYECRCPLSVRCGNISYFQMCKTGLSLQWQGAVTPVVSLDRIMVHVGGLWLLGKVLTGHRWVLVALLQACRFQFFCAMILVTFSGWVLSWLVCDSWHCLERVRSVWVLSGVGVDVMQLGLG